MFLRPNRLRVTAFWHTCSDLSLREPESIALEPLSTNLDNFETLKLARNYGGTHSPGATARACTAVDSRSSSIATTSTAVVS
jgi:hypothetical protein